VEVAGDKIAGGCFLNHINLCLLGLSCLDPIKRLSLNGGIHDYSIYPTFALTLFTSVP